MKPRFKAFKSRPGQTEITLLFGKCKRSDGKEKKKAEKELFEKLSYIPKEIAAGMTWARNTHDILYAGYLGLLKGIKWYDHKKCDNFYMVGKSYVVKEIEREKKKEGRWITGVFGNAVDIQDIKDEIADDYLNPEQQYLEVQETQLFKSLINSLKDPARTVVKKAYGLGEDDPSSVRQIADEMGLSIAKVIRLRTYGVDKLKQLYHDHEHSTANRYV